MATKKKAATKDPKGGLTAAGRAKFAKKDGAHLKPGVKKPLSEMSVAELKRKGSWAARFYGREGELPALRDAHGKPTRFALTAAAWGEPVPKTVTAARKIAERGRRLLERAKRMEEKGKTAKKGVTRAAKKKSARTAKKSPAKKSVKTAKRAAPWKRPRPKQAVKHLTPAQKSRARARAQRAGRNYPNLVDNMRVAGEG